MACTQGALTASAYLWQSLSPIAVLMPDNTTGQGLAFLICLAAGAVIGAVYEVFFIVRFTLGSGRITSAVLDVAFFLCAAHLVLSSSALAVNGAIYVYTAAAYLIGFTFERLTLGKLVAKSIDVIYNVLTRIKSRFQKKPRRNKPD